MTHLIPDLDYFRGSFGAKHVIPLWRDAGAEKPNVTRGLLDALAAALGGEVVPEELFSYCYALLSAPDYVGRFAEELEVPGPRVPLTRELDLFLRTVELGERLVWLHTFGERLPPEGRRAGEVPHGRARAVEPVGGAPEGYPTRHSYDEEREELHVGSGVFAPVSRAVRGYSVSGLDVIGSWLDYRMREGAGRRSSPLDRIRPSVWPAAFTEELLRLLWIVEATVDMGPALNEALAEIVEGTTFHAEELPTPSAAERSPPLE